MACGGVWKLYACCILVLCAIHSVPLHLSATVDASLDIFNAAHPFISRRVATCYFTPVGKLGGVVSRTCQSGVLVRDDITCGWHRESNHYKTNPSNGCYLEIRELSTNIASPDNVVPARKFSYRKKVDGRPPRRGKQMRPTGIMWHKQSRYETTKTPDTCSLQQQNGADIVFVVDSSASQSPALFEQQKSYIKSFISNFPIGPSDYQFAVTSYGFEPTVHCHLNSHSTEAGLHAAVDRMSYDNGTSYAGSALKVVGDEMLTAANGVRSGTARYVIVMTDGMSSNIDDTKTQAQLLQGGSTLFTVAFGEQIYHPELVDIASDCRKVFPSSLQDPVFTIMRNNLPVCPDCFLKTSDVAILFDASIDISHSKYYPAIDHLTRLLEAMPIGSNNVHVSYTQFAQDVHDQFDFTSYQTSNDVVTHIVSQRTRYPGPSNLTNALDHVTNKVFLDSRGRRHNARKFAIVFTGGQFDNFASVQTSAGALKNSGVTLALVSMGTTENNLNMTSLLDLASDPAFSFVLSIPEIDLCSIVSSVEFDVCKFD